MLCADGNRLGQELVEARQVFDAAETDRPAETSSIEVRIKEQARARQKLSNARFAFVNHRAACKVCESDCAPTIS
jgi:hypothetical protein